MKNMIPNNSRRAGSIAGILLLMFVFMQTGARGQVLINLATVDGVDLRPENIFSFQIQSMQQQTIQAEVRGTVRFRNSQERMSYSFRTSLRPGVNFYTKEQVQASWDFSSTALKELFFEHRVLPQGTYEYCVSVRLLQRGGEYIPAEDVEECVFRTSDDLFLINLVEPEDEAEIYEYHPMLTWVVNYPMAHALSYRLRVVPIHERQNTANAVARNNPVFEDRNLRQTSIVYPVYARPLELNQPYGWTVDAYYKGLLLGGAEPWRFTIVEDSVMEALPDQSSYIDVNKEEGSNVYYAVGNIKLKYAENDFLQNELKVSVLKKGKVVRTIDWKVKRGDNLTASELTELGFRHKEPFEIMIEFLHVKAQNNKQTIKYKYVNPHFVK